MKVLQFRWSITSAAARRHSCVAATSLSSTLTMSPSRRTSPTLTLYVSLIFFSEFSVSIDVSFVSFPTECCCSSCSPSRSSPCRPDGDSRRTQHRPPRHRRAYGLPRHPRCSLSGTVKKSAFFGIEFFNSIFSFFVLNWNRSFPKSDGC